LALHHDTIEWPYLFARLALSTLVVTRRCGSRAAMAQASPKPKESLSPAQTDGIHLVVDLNRCQAYAQCCFLAPDAFKLHGEEALWYDPAPDPAQREHILRAAAACPVWAIHVEYAQTATKPEKAEQAQSRQSPTLS